jgi:hypothetical protein
MISFKSRAIPALDRNEKRTRASWKSPAKAVLN